MWEELSWETLGVVVGAVNVAVSEANP